MFHWKILTKKKVLYSMILLCCTSQHTIIHFSSLFSPSFVFHFQVVWNIHVAQFLYHVFNVACSLLQYIRTSSAVYTQHVCIILL